MGYLIDRYHYLDYKRAVARGIINNILVGLIGFTDCISHHNLRGGWIGCDMCRLGRNIYLIISNFRFLILAWLRIKKNQ